MIVYFFTDGDTPEEVEEWSREVDPTFVLAVELGRTPSTTYVRTGIDGAQERRYRCWRVEWRDRHQRRDEPPALGAVVPWINVELETED